MPFLMEAFVKNLQSHLMDPLKENLVLDEWSKIVKFWRTNESDFDISLREALHDAIEASTTYLLRLDRKAVIRVVGSHLNAAISELETLEEQFDLQLDERTEQNPTMEQLFMDHYFKVIRPAVMNDSIESPYPKTSNEEIWMVLMFRMLCWLLLHDFAEEDINILPSDLNGSRMPIYLG